MRELVAIDVTKLVALSAEYEHQVTTGCAMKKILCCSLMMCGTLLAVRPDPWLESAKESYAYSTWANQTKKNYLRPLLNHEWPVLDLSTNGVDLVRACLFPYKCRPC